MPTAADASPADAVSQAFAELLQPTTPERRRLELQSQLQAERERVGAWRSYRAALSSPAPDEALLWFSLSAIEAALRDSALGESTAAERAQLKADLHAMLCGPAAASLPPSARGKGVQALAMLARATWPAEDPGLLRGVLGLLAQPGPTRALGAKLLVAIADEFSPSARHAQWRRHEDQQAHFVAFLPEAHAALCAAVGGAAGGGADSEDALACLEACRAIIGFGRLRDGAERGRSREFSAEEAQGLPPLLQAVAAHLVPRQVAGVAGPHLSACAAYGALTELCEVRDQASGALLAPLIGPMVAAAQALAAAPYPPYDLQPEALDELEAACCYALEALSRTWLLKIAPASAPPILSCMWAHGLRSTSAALRRVVVLTEGILEAAEATHGAESVATLVDGLLPCVRELVGRLQLSSSAAAAADFGAEAEELWEEGGGGGGGGEEEDDDGDAREGGDDGDGEDESFVGFLKDATALLCRLAPVRPAALSALLSEALTPLLPDAAGAYRDGLLAPFDAATTAGMLAATLPAAALATPASLAEQLGSITTMLFTALTPPPPPPPRPGPACRAELALLRLLAAACDVLAGWLGSDDAGSAVPLSAIGGADVAAVGVALGEGVSLLLSRASVLLPRASGGGVVGRHAAALLLETAAKRWPPCVIEAGGPRRLAAMGGGSLAAHAAAADVPAECWPQLFASVGCSLLLPSRGLRMAQYRSSLPPEQKVAFDALVETLVAPLRPQAVAAAAAADGGGAVDDALRPPARCLSAVVQVLAEAPREVRLVVDEALQAAGLQPALAALLAQLPSASPPPLGGLGALLHLTHSLTRAVGGQWGGSAAAQWALRAALDAVGLVVALPADGPSARAREGVLRAALRLLLSYAEKPGGASACGALLGPIVDACGPAGLGSLLGAHVPEASRLSPPRRAELFGVVGALLRSHWKAVSSCEPQLSCLLALLASGLQTPDDAPAFRRCLPAVVQLHQRWATDGTVDAARSALGGGAQGGGAQGGGGGGGEAHSAALSEQAMELRCMLLRCRLEHAHASLHEDAAQALHACVAAKIPAVPCEDFSWLFQTTIGGRAQLLVDRTLKGERVRGLSAEQAANLLADFGRTDVNDQPTFETAIARLANDVASLAAEASHSARGLF